MAKTEGSCATPATAAATDDVAGRPAAPYPANAVLRRSKLQARPRSEAWRQDDKIDRSGPGHPTAAAPSQHPCPPWSHVPTGTAQHDDNWLAPGVFASATSTSLQFACTPHAARFLLSHTSGNPPEPVVRSSFPTPIRLPPRPDPQSACLTTQLTPALSPQLRRPSEPASPSSCLRRS